MDAIHAFTDVAQILSFFLLFSLFWEKSPSRGNPRQQSPGTVYFVCDERNCDLLRSNFIGQLAGLLAIFPAIETNIFIKVYKAGFKSFQYLKEVNAVAARYNGQKIWGGPQAI